MKRVFLLSGCLALLGSPAYAWYHHDGGGGGAFIGSFLGGAAGSVVGNALSQPAPPPAPVYVTPVPRTVYVAPTPVYVQPAYTLQAQQKLHDLGLLTGSVDGVYGEGTRRAILNWQTLHNRPASGYLSNDDLALLLPETQPQPMQQQPVQQQPVQQQPLATAVVTAPAAIVPVAVAPTQMLQQPAPPSAMTPSDPFSIVKEGMPYGQARQKLANSGWQTGFFSAGTSISDSDRNNRAYFVDHRMMEVEDCATSGCAMQFHNNDGRVLYVFTQSGSRDSDAYRGAGPAVIGMCMDHKDMACTSDAGAPQAQAAR